jgi:hypothetical protein
MDNMHSPVRRRLWVWTGALCWFPVLAHAQPPELQNAVVVQGEEVLVRPNAHWVKQVTAPGLGDAHAVLWLEARLHLPGGKGGGCNWLLRVFVDDQVLTEAFSRPRLLNKAPFFDFAEGKYHFSWYREGYQAWMMMFADAYDTNTSGAGRDAAFLFDLNDYVQPGQAFRLRFEYAQPNLPPVLKQDAPLAVRNLVVGSMKPEAVEQLREKALSGDRKRRQIEIRPEVDSKDGDGERPYEIAWANRSENPSAQVSFERLVGWQGTVFGDAEVAVSASRAQRLWRSQVAKVSVGACQSFVVGLKPPKPIPIPADADAVNCWVHSNHLYSAGSTPVELLVTVVDSRGACVDLNTGPLRGNYWELRQGLLPAQRVARLQRPLYFHSLTLSAGKLVEPVTMYLESLAFFKRERRPYARLERLTDPGFPTTEDNMLPPAKPEWRTRAAATQDGKGATFTTTSPDGALTYAVVPTENGLSEVTARFGDGPTFQPLADGALELAAPSDTTGGQARLLSSRLAGGSLVTKWALVGEGADVTYQVTYQLRGRTLLVDVSCPGGRARGLRLGKVRGLPQLRGIEVPYLVMHRPPTPRVALGGKVFCSVLVDWYHSNCSVLDTTPAADEPDADGLTVNGGTVYNPLTDGKRNELRDRVLVTVSPEFHDTLPSIATPRSERIEELAPAMFVMSSDFTPGFYRTLKRYGLDEVLAVHFAGIWWRRAGEGFAMRWRPRPELTEEQVRRYREDLRGLGYLWGMLVNYTCYSALNEYWDENKVSLTSAGQLNDGWFGHFDTKPNAMPELAEVVGENIRARYPTDCVYLDVHTNWGADARDYEAGVDGAGTARGTILGNAACLREVHNQQHALCSEGICRWLYAGVADMDYAQWAEVTKPEGKPLLPDFDLLRIHPKQIGTAMGYSPTCFFTTEGLEAYYRDPGKGTAHQPFYHYVAATLAHGHSAMIGYSYFPPLARTLHYYALLSGPQEDYLPDTVADIAWYSDKDGEFLSTSEALRAGVRDAGKLRVTYAGGQVVHVNYHAANTWKLSRNGRDFELPPYGWLIEKPGSLFAYSTLVDGRRVDYVDCPRYLYLNSGDRPATEGALTADGAVLVQKGESLTVIPCGDLGGWKSARGEDYPLFADTTLAGPPPNRGVRQLRLNAAELLNLDPAARVTVRSRSEQGAAVSTEASQARNVELPPLPDTVDYLIAASP